ncbi:head-tail connector protein [Brevundimonas subvibrioides]|uniref:Bacteriophage QLRG family, putative DNA packaging n=1 Tax=Brevundimonas subvibrioides (strain ATCC 15264 / DSM 4735 / LMG 14903 / NBRC 16000 / CB 81) TaxID=633149 RepID=D9QF86_BRESC|nr:head-tail connector protein [Brevundimonas subvibrioides]ADL00571.1 Bacteriophage QLRG family, putative DNA packaging [Brevundimonas subvibrioides ATCC 15264]
MTAPVTLTEAKLFLRVEHAAEDGLIQTLIDAAQARVEGEVGLGLTSTSAAPLRLAILMLALRAYERGEVEMSIRPVEAWIAPYRVVRL